MKMKITSRNKIIGCAFVKWHGQYIALDLYEGNMVRYPDGNIGAIKEDLYKKYVKQYEDQVRNNKPISTAHEANAKMGVKFRTRPLTRWLQKRSCICGATRKSSGILQKR